MEPMYYSILKNWRKRDSYDSKKEKIVLASQDKVVDIRKGFNDISEEEFLSKVHQKFFSDGQ